MDTRALSMARSLRSSATVSVLVLFSVCGSAFAQQQGDGLVTVPFSSLSASAQQEIIALQGGLNRAAPVSTPLFPLEAPAARDQITPLPSRTVMLDGRRVRINWAVGMYR
jgi:hypothetical protein